MDGKGSISSIFGVPDLNFEAREISPLLFGMSMNTDDALSEYVKLYVRIPLIGRIGTLARIFDFVAQAAPGVREILSVGKLCWEVREDHYDLVIVDAEASGHIISNIGAPEALNELVKVGMIREQTRWMRDILDDHRRTGVVVVTSPEEMPITEAIEILERIGTETNVDVAAVIANRVLPELFTVSDSKVFAALTPADIAPVVAGEIHASVEQMFEGLRLVQSRRTLMAGHLSTLVQNLSVQVKEIPLLVLPDCPEDQSERVMVDTLVLALGDELS